MFVSQLDKPPLPLKKNDNQTDIMTKITNYLTTLMKGFSQQMGS
jgi:hypothetical protein